MKTPGPIVAEFDYTPSRKTTAGLFSLVTMGAVLLTCMAFAPGLLGWQPVKPDRWPFIAFMAALSPIGVFGIGCNVYLAFAAERLIRLTPSHALIPEPKGWQIFGAERAIPLAEIRGVRRDTHRVHGVAIFERLRIWHPEGNLVLISLMFRSDREFHRFAETLQQIVE